MDSTSFLKVIRGLALTFFAALSVCGPIHGQLRNANWLFDSNWVSFADGFPVSIPISNSYQSLTSLSDTTGSLLVYFTLDLIQAIGTGVRGPDHELIEGNPSFDGNFADLNQSHIFVPKPGDPERAYLIAWNRIPIADIDRFGILEIFLGNSEAAPHVISEAYNWFMPGAACKRMVIPHANGEDYWFVAQLMGTNEFHAYLISNNGLSSTPIVSVAGTVIPAGLDHGKLIPTVDGSRFVSVSESIGYSAPIAASSITEIHSFDPGTGQVQHWLTIDAPTRVDGVEFSPSGRYLYVSYWTYVDDITITHGIFQYDLDTTDPNASPALMDSYALAGLSGFTTNVLAHAPDGRIYLSHYVPTIGVIDMPDLPFPQCGYEHDGFGTMGTYMGGLPSFAKRYNDPAAIGPMAIIGKDPSNRALVLPHPISGPGELRWDGPNEVRLQWIDPLGRLVHEENATLRNGRAPLDVSTLTTGHYVLRIVHEGKVANSLRVSVVH